MASGVPRGYPYVAGDRVLVAGPWDAPPGSTRIRWGRVAAAAGVVAVTVGGLRLRSRGH